MRFLATTVLTLIAASYAFAQKPSPTPVKVAESIGSRSGMDRQSLEISVRSFIRRLKSEPESTRGAVIFYNRGQITDCISGEVVPDKTAQDFVTRLIGTEPDLKESRITLVVGDMSIRTTVEYWIVPSGGSPPKPAPIDYDPGCCCMALAVYGPESAKRGQTIRFFEWATSSNPDPRLKFKWTVSGAKVISGQNTPQVQVKISSDATSVSAMVEIDGLDKACNCVASASATTAIRTP